MNKVYSFLGFAQRAGKLVSGEQAVEGGVRRGRMFLIVIASDASDNTRTKFVSLAHNYNVKCHIYGTKDQLGLAIGKSQRAVIGIADRNFANVIQTHINESVHENN
ncbi:MAG: 50S ribosomal protein L7ae [Firmicutes bacterium]|jgi:ribosomal protein L7Ae-like RNA K-turn-binding protein|nr:50S ribosomal protein L7ae [Bacillota bacterium]